MVAPKTLEKSERMKFPTLVPLSPEEVEKRRSKNQLPHEFEVVGGRGRLWAAQAMYQQFLHDSQSAHTRDFRILVTGGLEKAYGLSRSREATRQLTEEYNIPPEKVQPIGQGGSTLLNAQDTLQYLKTHQAELGKINEVEIVTQDFHMLRAWLMFTAGVYQHFSGEKLVQAITLEDKEKISQILQQSLREEHATAGREQVMQIVQKYLEKIPIRVVPRVVEEVLAELNFPGAQEYAQSLSSSSYVQAARQSEAQGVVDFLNEKYE